MTDERFCSGGCGACHLLEPAGDAANRILDSLSVLATSLEVSSGRSGPFPDVQSCRAVAVTSIHRVSQVHLQRRVCVGALAGSKCIGIGPWIVCIA
jgi:hypothetical protein